jgi:hypothetical protein
MSSEDNKTPQFDGDDGALRDPVWRRALDHAPDHDALPDPRTRDAIRKMAHNLATTTATPPPAAAPWWRRLFGGGETHARMPWNAAFATVLVATFVTVLWHREPVPDARLDGEASAPAPAAVPPAPAPAPTPTPTPAQPATEASRDAATGGSPQRREDPVRRAAPAPVPADKPAAPAPVIAGAPPAPSAPALAQPSPAPMAEQSAPPAPRAFPRTEERREESDPENRQQSRVAAGAPPAAAMAPAAPPPPPPRESADSSVSPALSAAQRSASANSGSEAAGALRQAPAARSPAPAPAPAAAAAKASPEDTSAFSALDRWTSLNLMRGGQGVRQARGDTEGLAELVNTAARSATAPGAELAAPVEARLELYRGATPLAVLEIAGDQVRWTPQAGTSGGASVGTPPASTLAALRALLVRQ